MTWRACSVGHYQREREQTGKEQAKAFAGLHARSEELQSELAEANRRVRHADTERARHGLADVCCHFIQRTLNPRLLN